jgi:anti-anti-sigma factor
MRLVARDGRAGPAPAANRAQPARGRRARERELTLAGSGDRAHTLIPTGRLDRTSAAVLEAELERLYDAGITAVVLDLRELTYLDATGVAVLAFRSQLCKRRGTELHLIPGSRLMRRAFEAAGVTSLRDAPEDPTAPSRPSAPRALGTDEVARGEGSRAG